jgi:hypothetical protein
MATLHALTPIQNYILHSRGRIRPCPPLIRANGVLRALKADVTRHRTKHRCLATSTIPRKLDGEIDWENVDWDTYDWKDYEDERRGPAYEKTLQTLQWPAVCAQVATFASTIVGKQRCQNLEISRNPARTLVRACPAVQPLPCTSE